MVPASAGVILQGRELAEVMKNGTRKRGGDFALAGPLPQAGDGTYKGGVVNLFESIKS